MKLSTKLLLSVVLPVLLLLAGIGALFQKEHRSRAVVRAQASIGESTASVADIIQTSIAKIDSTLVSVLASIDGELGPADVEVSQLQKLCSGLLQNHPEFLGLELYGDTDEPLLMLRSQDGLTPTVPGLEQDAWHNSRDSRGPASAADRPDWPSCSTSHASSSRPP